MRLRSTHITVHDALLQVVDVDRDGRLGLYALVEALVGAGAVLVGRGARGEGRPLVPNGDGHG